MTTDSLIRQIQSIEIQLAVLKAQIKRLGLHTPPKTLGELEGILSGAGDFSEEEIDAALYRFDWEEEGETAEPPE